VSTKSPSPSAPNSGRFPKGSSGNPGGRPKASRAVKRSAFDIVLDRKFTVAHGAGTREITAEEAHQRVILRDALAGNRSAVRDVVKWIMKREAWLAKHAPKASGPPISLISSPDPDNADAALALLEIATPDPAGADHRWNRSQLLIEPWAVQAALRRRRGGNRLTDKDRDSIRLVTRDPDSLRWPRGTPE
jgi:hypothetical protein